MSILTYYTLMYFLVGTVVGFFLELAVVTVGNQLRWGERIWVIILWPIMALTFVFNFIKSIFHE